MASRWAPNCQRLLDRLSRIRLADVTIALTKPYRVKMTFGGKKDKRVVEIKEFDYLWWLVSQAKSTSVVVVVALGR